MRRRAGAPLRDTSVQDEQLASCPWPHDFVALPETGIAEHLWRRKCRVCGGVYSGREFAVFLEAVRMMRTKYEAAYEATVAEMSAEAEQPRAAGGSSAP